MGQYISTWYNTDNGLPQNSIKDIIKDRYGFIWLATENGIIRYDGQNFIAYSNIKVKNLHFDIFHGNISADSIFCFNDYMQDKILINHRSVKVSKTNNPSSIQRLNLEPDVIRIHKIDISKKIDKNATYYIKTLKGEYSFKNNTVKYSVNGESTILPIFVSDIRDIFLDHDTLYIVDKAHRKTYSVYRGKVSMAETSSIINDPSTVIHWHQANNQTFIINNGHIYLLKTSNGSLYLKFLAISHSLQKDSITSIYYDRNYKRLYLASPIKGLQIIEPNQFRIPQKNIPFQTEVSYASLPFSASTIIDSRGNVLNNSGIVKKYNFKYGDQYIMFLDSLQNIIIGHASFLTTYTHNSGYTRAYTVNFNRRIIGLFNEPGLHAVATVDSSDTMIHFFENDQFQKIKYTWRFSGAVKAMMKYSTEELLVGSSDGLYSINLNGKNKQRLIDAINVKSIIRTSDGEIWVTTRKDGYFMIKNRKAVQIPTDQNLFLSTAHFIQYDSLGHYWISSDNGLFKISKKQLLQYITKKTPPEYYRFTKKTGLSVNEFNGGILPNAYSLKNRELVFPSMEGFVFFNPEKIISYYPEKSSIFIERARINNNEVINFDKQLTVENSSDQIEIFIDFPYYSDIANINIEAKIKGIKKGKWQQIEFKDAKKIKLPNLDPGMHTIEFRILVSEDGKYEYRNVIVHIKPLFYQTVVFKATVIMFIILSIGTFVKTRSKFLNKRNKALKRTVYSMSSELKDASENLHIMRNEMEQQSEYQKKLIETISHDISTPVKFIAMLSQKLHSTDNLEFQKKYFDSIHKASEELYKFTQGLKEYNDLYKTDMIYMETSYGIHEVLLEKKNLFHEIARNSNNIISVEANSTTVCNINRNILSCIIHNIIDNAVKNTDSGIITVVLKETASETVITIEDTGCGMSPEQIQYYNDLFSKTNQMTFKNYGLGLHMVIHLIKKIDARIMFIKGLTSGTTVIITLKK